MGPYRTRHGQKAAVRSRKSCVVRGLAGPLAASLLVPLVVTRLRPRRGGRSRGQRGCGCCASSAASRMWRLPAAVGCARSARSGDVAAYAASMPGPAAPRGCAWRGPDGLAPVVPALWPGAPAGWLQRVARQAASPSHAGARARTVHRAVWPRGSCRASAPAHAGAAPDWVAR